MKDLISRDSINSNVGRLLESCDVKWFVPLAHQV